MEGSNFSPDESIKTIEEAFKQARSEKTGATFYYILWGTLLMLHYLLLFFVTKFPDLKGGFTTTLIWSVFPIGGFLCYLKGKKEQKTENVLSLYEKVYLFAFGGFALTYGMVFFSSLIQHSSLFISLFPLLLGFTVFVVGGITKHNASIIGGVLGIILSSISLNISLEYQYLLAALSSLISCLIPGLLMINKNV